jgi:thioredoxin reductase (NADPH)
MRRGGLGNLLGCLVEPLEQGRRAEPREDRPAVLDPAGDLRVARAQRDGGLDGEERLVDVERQVAVGREARPVAGQRRGAVAVECRDAKAGRTNTPRGYPSPVLRLRQDNGIDTDDNRRMTDEKNGTNGASKPFGGMQINFGGGADAAAAPGASLNPFGSISIVSDGPDEIPAQPAGPVGYTGDPGRTETHVLIIGSGPAGLTAAIYAARANLQPIVLAGSAPGGQLMLTSDVENYPGFPDGIDGPELMAKMRAQAERFGSQIVDVDIERVDFSGRPFRVWARGVQYTGQSVIIATGASALWLNLESEQRLRGRGVSACATCDGFFFRNREIAVVGGGDSAMEEANFLTKFATKVHLLHRRDAFRASKIMIDRTYNHPKIEVHTNTEVAEVLGDAKVEGLKLRDTETGAETEVPMEGLFIAIGHKPNTDVFSDWLEVDEKGYLVAHDHIRSRIDGVFIAGDVHDHRYRQAVTAAGDGCKAAIDAERWLEREGLAEHQTATAW